MKNYFLLFSLLFSFFLYSIIVLADATSCSSPPLIGDVCCADISTDTGYYCVEGIDWGFCHYGQPVNCTDYWPDSGEDYCCCNGTISLKCSVPPLENPNDERILTGSCGRTNATIDCDGNLNSHHVCNSWLWYPLTDKCILIEPKINSYSAPTSITKGESFSIVVNSNCPKDLPGKCLIECRIIHPDGHNIELDTWSNETTVVLPPVTCDQVGDYVVDYCGVFTDFSANDGWGDKMGVEGSDPTDKIITCTPTPECSDGIDNDNDGTCDATDNACGPGILADPDCDDADDNTECGDEGTSCTIDENCCNGLICGISGYCEVMDFDSPTYSYDKDDSGGSVTPGTEVKVSVLWNDDSELGNAIFRYKIETDIWKNVSLCPLSGNSGWCNKTITPVEDDIGKIICWNQWANDTIGNWNNSMSAHCFNVVSVSDAVPPTYNYDNDNSKGSVNEGVIVNISVYWQDAVSNLDVVEFYHNMSGSMSLSYICSFSSQQGWCNKTIYTTGFSGTVCWNQFANDTSGNLNNSMPIHCFDVISSTEEVSKINPESILESIRKSISSSTTEFSTNFLVLAFQFLGIIVLVIILIIVVQQLVQSMS
ncbi:MAG: hypothetical protein ACTSWZ_02965 [Candidatus Heimdallarchaeaceae archaeon]